jgi:hypothetical protein
MSWDRPFDQPVPLPSGPAARTLHDAARYIAELPPSERESREWRFASEMLIEAAEDRASTLLAKIGIQRAVDARSKKDGASATPPAAQEIDLNSTRKRTRCLPVRFADARARVVGGRSVCARTGRR